MHACLWLRLVGFPGWYVLYDSQYAMRFRDFYAFKHKYRSKILSLSESEQSPEFTLPYFILFHFAPSEKGLVLPTQNASPTEDSKLRQDLTKKDSLTPSISPPQQLF